MWLSHSSFLPRVHTTRLSQWCRLCNMCWVSVHLGPHCRCARWCSTCVCLCLDLSHFAVWLLQVPLLTFSALHLVIASFTTLHFSLEPLQDLTSFEPISKFMFSLHLCFFCLHMFRNVFGQNLVFFVPFDVFFHLFGVPILSENLSDTLAFHHPLQLKRLHCWQVFNTWCCPNACWSPCRLLSTCVLSGFMFVLPVHW